MVSHVSMIYQTVLSMVEMATMLLVGVGQLPGAMKASEDTDLSGLSVWLDSGERTKKDLVSAYRLFVYLKQERTRGSERHKCNQKYEAWHEISNIVAF